MRRSYAACLTVLVGLFGAAAAARAAEPVKEKPQKAFSDAEFVKKAASGGMYEVELGKVASEKATMPEVKKFGEMMVTDHTKANEELKKIAKANKMDLPEAIMEKEQKMLDSLKKMKGPEFDKAYVADMVKDHEMDIAEFTRASKDAQNPDLREFAAKCLPTLKEHLKMVQELNEKVK